MSNGDREKSGSLLYPESPVLDEVIESLLAISFASSIRNCGKSACACLPWLSSRDVNESDDVVDTASIASHDCALPQSKRPDDNGIWASSGREVTMKTAG